MFHEFVGDVVVCGFIAWVFKHAKSSYSKSEDVNAKGVKQAKSYNRRDII